MTEEERGRLTDNQLLMRFAEGDRANTAINKEILEHRSLIGEVRDEITGLRSESRARLKQVAEALEVSRQDRESIKTDIIGIADCINDLKAWQYDYDRRKQDDNIHQRAREEKQDTLQREIEKEFEWRKRFAKWRNGILIAIGGFLGALASALGVISVIKDLFTNPHP